MKADFESVMRSYRIELGGKKLGKKNR